MKKYPSGFGWEEKESEWNLIAPSGLVAATVFKTTDCGNHNWFVWDEHGTGGENSSEPTIRAAKVAAESATLRWGMHSFEPYPVCLRCQKEDAAQAEAEDGMRNAAEIAGLQ